MKLGFSNGQQFKAKVRNLAKEKQIDPQILMQKVALDEIVDRISRSPYRDNLILKGGFLIASMLGVDTRATRDVDTSVKGLPVTKEEILKVFTDIANMNEPDSDVTIRIAKIDDIRVAAEYAGFRIHIEAKIYNSVVDTKIDVSTGTQSRLVKFHGIIARFLMTKIFWSWPTIWKPFLPRNSNPWSCVRSLIHE